jgi:predicted nucleic acid-binding protein
MRNILVDTGAVVGLLNDKDRYHERAEEFFASVRPADKLLSTWPVITECSFLLRHREDIFWNWLLESDIEIIEFTVADIPAMRAWRSKYDDREVDFADATLAWLGGERRTNLLATTDFDDFDTYRLSNGKPFKLLIERR